MDIWFGASATAACCEVEMSWNLHCAFLLAVSLLVGAIGELAVAKPSEGAVRVAGRMAR